MVQRSCGRSWMETCRLKPFPLNCSVLGSSSRRPPLTHSSTATAWGGPGGEGQMSYLCTMHTWAGIQNCFPSYGSFTIPWKRRALSGRAGERLASCSVCSGHMRPPPPPPPVQTELQLTSPNPLSNVGLFGTKTVQPYVLLLVALICCRFNQLHPEA